jgi:hypothetical protein
MSAKIGKPAPEFKSTAVIDGNFKDVSLKDYKGKYVVLFFYPLDFTFVCPTGIQAIDRHDKITFASMFRNHLIQRSSRRISPNQLRNSRMLNRFSFQPFSMVVICSFAPRD